MRYLCLIPLLLTLLIPAVHARVWTDIMGRSLDAEFVEADEHHVTVRRNSDRRIFKIELAQLQDVDRDFVQSQRATQAASAPADEIVRTPQTKSFEDYKARLKRFRFQQGSTTANFLGVMSVVNRPIGTINRYPRGLSIGPDGGIVMTMGSGSTQGMEIARWSPSGETKTIRAMTYTKFDREQSDEQRAKDESEGRFWFFSGQVAHDRHGEVLITLGPRSGNGIFRVSETDDPPFKRLNNCSADRSIQVPSWDNEYAYVTLYDGIKRFRIFSESAAEKGDFLNVEGYRVFLSNTLLLDSKRLIACVTMPTDEKDSRGATISGTFGILIDRSKGGYYLISDDQIGPMAIAPDGSRMIRATKNAQGKSVIAEFTLRQE